MLADQLTTFRIRNCLYGVDVQVVQEVTKGSPLTPVPLAPPSIAGLLNLRGQIVTALDLSRLLGQVQQFNPEEMSFVICRWEGHLIALVVNEIGDVIELDKTQFETTPSTLSVEIKSMAGGVLKMEDEILVILDTEKIFMHGCTISSGAAINHEKGLLKENKKRLIEH